MRAFFHIGSGHWVRRIIELAAVCLALFLILSLIPTDIVVTVEEVIDEVQKVVEPSGVNARELYREYGDFSVAVVYSAYDDSERAGRLTTELNGVSYINASDYSDSEYAAAMPDVQLTVFLGHTSFYYQNYLDAYSRLGRDGLEISHSENSSGVTDCLYILAFDQDRLEEGISAFASYFLSTNVFELSLSTLYRIDARPATADMPDCITVDSSAYSVSVASYPDTDSYSEAALSGLLKLTSPDCVLFNGGLALSDTRSTLGEKWQELISSAEITDSTSVAFRYLSDEYKDGTSALAADVIEGLSAGNTVIGEGCRFVAFLAEDGTPLAGQFFAASDGTDCAAQAEKLRTYMSLLERAAGKKIPCVVYMSEIPASVSVLLPATGSESVQSGAVFYDSYASYVSDGAELIYSAAAELGISNFVFNTGYINSGVFEDGGVSFAFCGSIGFDNPGVGGRFSLNNSLRGLLSIVFDFTDEGENAILMSYVWAADHGLNIKNAG